MESTVDFVIGTVSDYSGHVNHRSGPANNPGEIWHNPYAYPIIITDLRMPGMNGIELANRRREINGTAKIFMVTAFDPTDLESKPDYRQAKLKG
jgi:CheY-like chemotaxis protein